MSNDLSGQIDAGIKSTGACQNHFCCAGTGRRNTAPSSLQPFPAGKLRPPYRAAAMACGPDLALDDR
ncbi:MAG: hypothetical protein WCI19_11965 [Betaproteobacteria bacterium]|nr:hypothetical protein [Rhodocyclales bacterium]